MLEVVGGPGRLSRESLRELWHFRSVQWAFVQRQLKVRYKQAVVGAGWVVLQPLIAYAIFALFLGRYARISSEGIPYFLFALAGMAGWGYFSSAASTGADSLVGNQNLLRKIYFPREILPLASEGTALVDFGLQTAVLALFMLGLRYNPGGMNLLLLPLSMFALLVFTAALALLVSALNVRYRDTQHLLNLALLAWFWMTPIVYPGAFVYNKLAVHHPWLFRLFLINPMADIVFGFQRALYGHVAAGNPPKQVLIPVSIGWLAMLLAAVSAGSIVLLWLAWRTFFRLSGDFAEEL